MSQTTLRQRFLFMYQFLYDSLAVFGNDVIHNTDEDEAILELSIHDDLLGLSCIEMSKLPDWALSCIGQRAFVALFTTTTKNAIDRIEISSTNHLVRIYPKNILKFLAELNQNDTS